MTYLDGRPRENLVPRPYHGVDRLPTRWRMRLRMAGLVGAVAGSQVVGVVLAHLAHLT
jgi:hypothetical protein